MYSSIDTKKNHSKPITTIEVQSWQELLTILKMFEGNWIFRGLSEAQYGLKSSLEKEIPQQQFHLTKKIDRKNVINHQTIIELEKSLIYNFQRRNQHFFEENDHSIHFTEMLSLMQHNGISTRLVDWTRSPYVASYFAMRRVTKNEPAAIWALNLDDIFNYAKSIIKDFIDKNIGKLNIANGIDRESIRKDREVFLKLLNKDITRLKFKGNTKNFSIIERITGVGDISNIIFSNIRYFKEQRDILGVVPMIPQRLNKRIMAQQAMFLCPLDIRYPFIDNLIGTYMYLNDNDIDCSPIIKIIIPHTMFKISIQELNLFNINGYSLMPDKAGLKDWFSEVFIPRKLKSINCSREKITSKFVNRLDRFLDTQIHFVIEIPNQPGAISKALLVFNEWKINIDHFTLSSENQFISRWTIDGKIMWNDLFDNKIEYDLSKFNDDVVASKFSKIVDSDLINHRQKFNPLTKKNEIATEYKEKWKQIENDINRKSNVELNEWFKGNLPKKDKCKIVCQITTDLIRHLITFDLKGKICGPDIRNNCKHVETCERRMSCASKEYYCMSNESFNRIGKEKSQ